MTRTHERVRYTPKGVPYTAITAAQGIEEALKVLEGRWKLIILFHLFGGKVLRFSDLERAIPAISQKMLIQQLRQMESDGVVRRTIYQQVPPKVEYRLTKWGQALCPALEGLLKWGITRKDDGKTLRDLPEKEHLAWPQGPGNNERDFDARIEDVRIESLGQTLPRLGVETSIVSQNRLNAVSISWNPASENCLTDFL